MPVGRRSRYLLDHFHLSCVTKVIQPISTFVSTIPRARTEVGTYPGLSALSVEQQLALIYTTKERSSSGAKKQIQTAREDAMMLSTVLPEEHDRVEAIVSTLISMPKSRNASDYTESEIVFGTIVFPWRTLSADQSILEDLGDLPRTIGT